MRTWRINLAVLICSVLFVSGCHRCGKHRRPDLAPPGCGCPTGTVTPGMIYPAPTPSPGIGGTGTLPPQAIPVRPIDPPPRVSNRPEILLPQRSPNGHSSNYAETPNNGGVILLEPHLIDEPAAPAPSNSAKQPTTRNDGASENISPQPIPRGTPKVSKPERVEPKPSGLPIGIAHFAKVKPGVSVGRRPQLEGLNWLQESGYKTVIYLRSPSEDDTSDKREAEKRGIVYRRLTVSDQTLNSTLLTEFASLVDEANNTPIFVYDNSGQISGAMWYLYFRTVERLDDSSAKAKAEKFGSIETTNDDSKALWIKVQTILVENP